MKRKRHSPEQIIRKGTDSQVRPTSMTDSGKSVPQRNPQARIHRGVFRASP